MNPVVETYSRVATAYDDPQNIASCWGRITRHSLGLVTLEKKHKTVGNGGKKVTDTAKAAECPTVPKTEAEPQTLGLFDQQPRPAEGDSTDAKAQVIVHAD